MFFPWCIWTMLRHPYNTVVTFMYHKDDNSSYTGENREKISGFFLYFSPIFPIFFKFREKYKVFLKFSHDFPSVVAHRTSTQRTLTVQIYISDYLTTSLSLLILCYGMWIDNWFNTCNCHLNLVYFCYK